MVIHNEHHFLKDMLHNNMSKIYVLQTTLVFVKSLIGIFIPVYLFSLGFPLHKIAIYMSLISIVALLLIPISTYTIKKIGYKYTILLSLPLYIFHISTLNFIHGNDYVIYLAAILYGLYLSFFWPAYHLEVSQQGSSKFRGKELGTLQVLTTLTSALSPIVGGFFLDFLSYAQLLLFAFFLMILGFTPFLFSKEVKVKKIQIKLRDYFRIFKKLHSDDKMTFFASGFEFVITVMFWPIVIFMILDNSFLKLGSIFSIVSLISVFFVVYFKSFLDKKSKSKILKLTTKCMSINWFFKGIILIFLTPFIFLLEGTQKLITTSFNLSFSSIFYNNAKKEKEHFEYVMGHEILIHFSRMIMALMIVLLSFIIGTSIYLFVIIALFSILIPFGLSRFQER